MIHKIFGSMSARRDRIVGNNALGGNFRRTHWRPDQPIGHRLCVPAHRPSWAGGVYSTSRARLTKKPLAGRLMRQPSQRVEPQGGIEPPTCALPRRLHRANGSGRSRLRSCSVAGHFRIPLRNIYVVSPIYYASLCPVVQDPIASSPIWLSSAGPWKPLSTNPSTASRRMRRSSILGSATLIESQSSDGEVATGRIGRGTPPAGCTFAGRGIRFTVCVAPSTPWNGALEETSC